MTGTVLSAIVSSPVGCYGKLASRGDFVSRDLPKSFVEPWDAWLAAGLQASQQSLGAAWLDAYLISPLWRFALAPGVCGEAAVVGVMMPSVDRVGRYFPLTVAHLLPAGAALESVIGGSDEWFERAETLLLATLEADASFERFEAALGQQGAPIAHPALPDIGRGGMRRCTAISPAGRINALAGWACAGASLWWGQGGENIAAGLLRCIGMPSAEAFTGLLQDQPSAAVVANNGEMH